VEKTLGGPRGRKKREIQTKSWQGTAEPTGYGVVQKAGVGGQSAQERFEGLNTIRKGMWFTWKKMRREVGRNLLLSLNDA